MVLTENILIRKETMMQIQNINEESFKKYGKILTGYHVDGILAEMEHTPLTREVVYVPSVEEMEALPDAEEMKNRGFGGLPIQIGYCNGDNRKLNGLEYHRSSEINIAVNNLVLLLGREQDIEADDTYDTSRVEAFFVPAGTVIEVYATTLHYAPCTAEGENGFRCVVVLPKGTNTELDFAAGAEGEDRLLAAKNKWLIAHEEAGIVGAFCGLKGENVTVKIIRRWVHTMKNMPELKIGVVAVSRDCFPESLSVSRREALIKAYREKYGDRDIYECPICIVESEIHMVQALEDIKAAGCNALVVYLGNFGPEISETLLAKHFDGPKMFVAAAEERGDNLIQGRGDAYCGMLNASYNLKLRNIKAYIPEYPIGTAEECADMIAEFRPVARAVIALNDLKIISFGPRPLNFLACNAPIQQLYNLGVEIEENSELDLFEAFNKHAGDERIPAVVKEMEEELGAGNKKPEILEKLAQYELTLKDWIEEHRGYRKYVAIAGKCWPAFQTQFGFVPCYVNSRLTAQGIPVSCEVDIYGALSELIGTVVSEDAVTLLDINNNVPADMYKEEIEGKFPYTHKDTFMGFHCGNTPSEKLSFCEMKYQLIMARSLPEEVTQGTLEGDIAPGNITFFRLQSTADCKLRAYIAQGEVLPVATRSFGSIGVFAIPEMGRFYRHVLIEKNFPHHGAVAFGNHGKALFEVFKYIGVPVEEIGYNQPAGVRYPTENPWK